MLAPDEVDLKMDLIRHQAIAGNPMVVLTHGSLLPRVREALAVAGRLDDLRVLLVDTPSYDYPPDGSFRQVDPGTMPDVNWVEIEERGRPLNYGVSREARAAAARDMAHPGQSTSDPFIPSIPWFDVKEAYGPTRVLVMMAPSGPRGRACALWLLDRMAAAAVAEHRPEPALLVGPPQGDTDGLAFLHDARSLGFRQEMMLGVNPTALATPAWIDDALGRGDLQGQWKAALAAYDAGLSVRTTRGFTVIDGPERTVACGPSNPGDGEPDENSIWEVAGDGRGRRYAHKGLDRDQLVRVARRVCRGGADVSNRAFGLQRYPVESLVSVARRLGAEDAMKLSDRMDHLVSNLSLTGEVGERVAWTIVSDPARRMFRRDFAETWPSFAKLLLDPECLRSVDSGQETVPMVAGHLGVEPAVARRLARLNVLPLGAGVSRWARRNEPRALGQFLSAIGHDRLPPQGDVQEWKVFRKLAAWLGETGDYKPEAAARMLVSIPGRNWSDRLVRFDGCGEGRDARDMIQALAQWLGAIAGQRMSEDRVIDGIFARQGSLLQVAEASRAWHGNPLLGSGPRGLPLDTAWPVPFDPFYLGMGLEARVLGSVQELVDEGCHGPDSRGVDGLGHCVGGYGDKCQTGESLILSIRRRPEEGGARISTVELVPMRGHAREVSTAWNFDGRPYVVKQHKALRNAEPTKEARDSLYYLRECIGAGAVPIRAEALARREPVAAREDARHAACFHAAWRRVLPRRFARMGLDELAEAAREIQRGGAPRPAPPIMEEDGPPPAFGMP